MGNAWNDYHEVGITKIHPSTMEFTKTNADGKTMHQLVSKYWDGVIVLVGDLDLKQLNKQ